MKAKEINKITEQLKELTKDLSIIVGTDIPKNWWRSKKGIYQIKLMSKVKQLKNIIQDLKQP